MAWYDGVRICSLRLAGLVARGSILLAMVGFIALLLIALVRLAGLKLPDQTRVKEELPMKQTTLVPKLFGFCVLETTWANRSRGRGTGRELAVAARWCLCAPRMLWLTGYRPFSHATIRLISRCARPSGTKRAGRVLTPPHSPMHAKQGHRLPHRSEKNRTIDAIWFFSIGSVY
jgi:hypothetical protein